MKAKKRNTDFLTIVVRFVFFCVVLFIGFKTFQYVQLNHDLMNLERNQKVFLEQIEELEEKIKDAETDFFIEKLAREESELAKPGDFVIKFKSR